LGALARGQMKPAKFELIINLQSMSILGSGFLSILLDRVRIAMSVSKSNRDGRPSRN
jgi:hypothetical protein